MRTKPWVVTIVAIMIAIHDAPLRAQSTDDDVAAVTATVQRLFDSFAKHDTVQMRRIIFPGTTILSLVVDSPDLPQRVQADTALIHSIGSTTDRLLERMWNPTVKMDGQSAILRAPYDFHRNGTFSHCGVDTMTLRRIADTWRIVGISYTVQRLKCSPSPLGAPTP
jgi:hypothetical protein